MMGLFSTILLVLEFAKEHIVELILTLTVTSLSYRWIKTRSKTPPGPWGIPFFGYLPFLKKELHLQLYELSKKYGTVFSMNIGQQYAVVLNDYESIFELYRMDEVSARPPGTIYMTDDVNMFGAENEETWKDRRKHFNRQQRFMIKSDSEEHGKNLESLIGDQISTLMTDLEALVGQPSADFKNDLHKVVYNIMNYYIFGKTLPHRGHHIAENWAAYQADVLNQALPHTWPVAFPFWRSFIRKILPSFSEYKKMALKVADFFNDEIEEHEKTLDPNSPRDYIDRYLIHAKETSNPHFTKQNLNGDSQLIIMGGSDTTHVGLQWLFLALATNQKIQEKVYQEIHQAFGTEKRPSWRERDHLPYTMATIMECLRWKTIVPTNSNRWTLEDVMVKGYLIPKGTLVISNNWAVNSDETYFDKPEEMRPERYLTQDGKFKSAERSLAFSIGKRQCAGKDHAIMQLYLIVTATVQKFKISPPEGGIDYKTSSGLVNTPINVRARFDLR